MFWGVTILGGRRYTQTVERSYHISKAAFDIGVDVTKDQGKKRVQLMLEQNKSHFLLCNLDTDKNVQVDLDLIFTEGEEVTFYLNGQGTVHLTGYVLDFEDVDDFDDFDEESEDEEVTNDNAKRILKADSSLNAKKSKVDAKANVNGLADEDDEEDESDDELGALDAGLDSDEDDEEEDEEDEESDEEEAPILQKPKPAQKQVNGQVPKLQQQQKGGTPAKGQQNQQNQKNVASAGKQNNQGGQQNKLGQKGQNSPQGGQKPLNQKGNQQQQQKGQSNQNKQQLNNNKAKGPFTPDQKASNKFNKNNNKMRKSFA